jgi:hypothetical protein
VRVDVDGRDPPALDDHRPPRHAGALCGLRAHARDAASDEYKAGRARDVLQECSSIGSYVRTARRDSTYNDIDFYRCSTTFAGMRRSEVTSRR